MRPWNVRPSKLSFTALVFMPLILASCDSMNAHRITVKPAAANDALEPFPDSLLTNVRATLENNGLVNHESTSDLEEWRWQDPNSPPGLWVAITRTETEIEVVIVQNPYGPIGPTEKYKSVKTALVSAIEAEVGEDRVQVKKGI
jgi:hypothetical protein